MKHRSEALLAHYCLTGQCRTASAKRYKKKKKERNCINETWCGYAERRKEWVSRRLRQSNHDAFERAKLVAPIFSTQFQLDEVQRVLSS